MLALYFRPVCACGHAIGDVSISQVIDCEDCLQNDLYCVEWGVKTVLQPTNQAIGGVL